MQKTTQSRVVFCRSADLIVVNIFQKDNQVNCRAPSSVFQSTCRLLVISIIYSARICSALNNANSLGSLKTAVLGVVFYIVLMLAIVHAASLAGIPFPQGF